MTNYWSFTVLLSENESAADLNDEQALHDFMESHDDGNNMLTFVDERGMFGLFAEAAKSTLNLINLNFLDYEQGNFSILVDSSYLYNLSILQPNDISKSAHDLEKILSWAKANPEKASELIPGWEGSGKYITEATNVDAHIHDVENLSGGTKEPFAYISFLRLLRAKLLQALAANSMIVHIKLFPV